MADHSYRLRKRAICDYRQLASVTLPREKQYSTAKKLYPIEIVATRDTKVRIHYIGYSDQCDEWREADDLVPINQTSSDNTIQTKVIKPYNLHIELGIKIKQALMCSKKQSLSVSIDMGFDYLLFKGGLEAAGVAKESTRGIQRYGLERYSDLDHLLGDNWHFRGINDRGDYGYVILDSVEYYLSKRCLLAAMN